MLKPNPRICYLHIGKSAGTWLRSQLAKNYYPSERCELLFQSQFCDVPREVYIEKKFFSAHLEFETAIDLDAKLITVLRNPVDRILSLYYYWKEVENGPKEVKNQSLEAFLDEYIGSTSQDLDDAQTWQIAAGHTNATRKKYSHLSKDEVLRKAIDNLERFDVVGIFENLPRVASDIKNAFGLEIDAGAKPVNVTLNRPKRNVISIDIQNRIFKRNEMDFLLYSYVCKRLLNSA